MGRFDDKIALVVAASRGIGLACAEALAKEGAKVYLGVRRLEVGQQIAASLREAGCKAEAVWFDATQWQTYAPMVEQVVEAEGRIDVLVNNFGATDVRVDKDVLHTDVAYFDEAVCTNLNSVFIPVQSAIEHMPSGAAIVNIGSIGGFCPDTARVSYCVAKAAIMSLTENIATQCAPRGIRCNCVMPGMVATEAVKKHMPQAFAESFLHHVPLKRFGTPEDIAHAVLFLASDEASFITGHCMPVAGGYRVPAPTVEY